MSQLKGLLSVLLLLLTLQAIVDEGIMEITQHPLLGMLSQSDNHARTIDHDQNSTHLFIQIRYENEGNQKPVGDQLWFDCLLKVAIKHVGMVWIPPKTPSF